MVEKVKKILALRWFPGAVALASVLVVVVLFAWPVIFGGRTLFNTHSEYPPSDETAVHLPMHVEVGRQMSQGHLPSFNPWPAFGIPLAADPNALTFDPWMAVFRGTGPDSVVLSWRSIVMAVAGAMAVFGFLWIFCVPLAGSVAGAMVYASLVLRYPPADELLIHYVATDWSMIGIFLLALAIRRQRVWAFPLAGVATGFAALSGHPQGIYFGLGLGLLYVFGEAWPRRGTNSKRVLAGGAGWLVIALCIAAAQIVPLAARVATSNHIFADPSHPEFDENLVGYAWTLLGPGLAMFVLVPMRRRWLEAWVFILTVLFFLTIMNTPIVRFWHVVLPYFSNFKLSSKYFISPFPILASVGLGLAIGFVTGWRGMMGRFALFACGVCALWPVWTAPYEIIYRLQQPAAQVEALDRSCVADIRENTPRFGRLVRFRTEALYPSQTVSAGIFDVHVAAGIIPARYAELMKTLNPEHADAVREDSRVRGFTDPEVMKLAFWDVAGASTMISGVPVDIPGWVQVLARPGHRCMTDDPDYYIYRNTEAFDRAFLVADARTPDGDADGLRFVSSPATPAPERLPGAAVITRYAPDEIVIDVKTDRAADLVLTDSFRKRWEVTVDGLPAVAKRTWYLFRAVSVPAGHHTVRWTYSSTATIAGFIAGIAGLAAAAAWVVTAAFVLPSWRRRTRGQGS